MDSSLNSAHQQSRKADSLTRSGKLDEAMYCHRRAAEFLLQAMQLSSCPKAKESISLQHQLHIKQQDILQQRLLRIEAYTLQKNCLKGDSESRATQTDHSLLIQSTEPQGYLVNRERKEFVDINFGESPKKSRGNNVKTCNSIIKIPRDDETLMEEVSTQNVELRRHISQLVKELEESQAEKDYLAHKLAAFEKGQVIGNHKDLFERSADEEDEEMKMPLFDLPPLEMPHFDFDSLPVISSVNITQDGNIFPTK